MSVIDASVMVSVYATTDVHYQQSFNWFMQAMRSRTPLVAPLLLLTEVGGALIRRTNDPVYSRDVVRRLQANPTIELVPLDEQLISVATDLAINLRLRGADATYVALALTRNLPLLSWDNEHLTRGAQVITVHTP